MNLFFYPNDLEVLETWISISSSKYFRVIIIEKQIRPFIFWEKLWLDNFGSRSTDGYLNLSVLSGGKLLINKVQRYFARAIISRGLYTFYPILEDHFLFSKSFFLNSVFMYGYYTVNFIARLLIKERYKINLSMIPLLDVRLRQKSLQAFWEVQECP